MENVLQLLLACLTFDFIGTAPEESTDDTGTLQIPTAWRPGSFNYLTLFLNVYNINFFVQDTDLKRFRPKNNLIVGN